MNAALAPYNILVPVDFSDFSRKALPVARELARIHKGRISPFHACDRYSDMDGFHYRIDGFRADGDPASIDQAIKAKLRQFAAETGAASVAPTVTGIRHFQID